jgi:hypothetical protein
MAQLEKNYRKRKRSTWVLTLAAAESFYEPFMTRLAKYELQIEIARAAGRRQFTIPPYDLAGLVQVLLERWLSGLSKLEIAAITSQEQLAAETDRENRATALEGRCLTQKPDFDRIVKIVRRHRALNDKGKKRPRPRR